MIVKWKAVCLWEIHPSLKHFNVKLSLFTVIINNNFSSIEKCEQDIFNIMQYINKYIERYPIVARLGLLLEIYNMMMNIVGFIYTVYIQSWPKISAPLANMIKEGCEN